MATLETIYRNQLKRAPDAGGLAHYQAQLASGRSIDDIRQEIANSPEARNRGVGAFAPSASNNSGSSSNNQSQTFPEKSYIEIFGRGGIYEDLKGGGRGLTAQIAQVQAGIQQRPDIFLGGTDNVGKTRVEEGYSFKGGPGKVLVDTISYKGNETYDSGTFNIYKDVKPAAPATAPEEPATTPEATTTVEPVTVSNPYQDQIDALTGQLGTISGQIGGYTDTINTLRGQIQTMQTDFGNQLKGIMDANTKALEDMSTQYQQQLTAQQEAQETARRQRELAAQTAAANQARAGQQADFQIGSGSGMMRGIFGGLAGFKRRGKIKAKASGALAIAATEGQTKSPNKMLNV
jgi:hypothetical protein|tara:strand:- start:43 stop:1086 length:1044 start_codon:yes stop_codon:yes gene_type:complete